jgi:hypothetical protein
MSEFDFCVEHTSGPEVTHVDALSQENHEAQNREQQVQQPLQSPSTAVGVATPIPDKETPVRHPDSTLRDPNYTPSRSPQSMRKVAGTPQAPPLTRSRARLQQLMGINNPP